MAESAITYVAQNLYDLLVQKAEFLKGVGGQVEWLRDELRRMQCFLKDADAKQEEDQRVHNWVTELRDAAYDAEDIVDTFLLKIESKRRQFGFIKRYALFPKELLEAFRARIADISRSRETYGIKSVGGEGQTSISRERLHQLRRSSPRCVDKDVVGMKKDVAELVAELIKKANQLRVISLVGMGGIGKTTLAKKGFNHKIVRGHFNCLAWFYVSQEFRPKDVLFGIIKEVIRPGREMLETMDSMQEDELEKILYEYLQEKLYLVVLDDVWTTEAWDLLKRAFPDNDTGSKVMLTTRNKDVALYADRGRAPIEMRLLDEEESWQLFLKKAFFAGNDDESCPEEFEDIGRKIVKRCDGLPLAIIVAGGLLFRKSLLSEWERVLGNIDSHFAKGHGGVFGILALSYVDLPHYLKSCFLHLSFFPEDFVISTRQLFQLWIAEGLIPQHEERLEIIAEDYLNELIDRNMIQVVKVSASKRVKQCRMHDVLRDYSIFKAKEEIFMETRGNTKLPPSTKSRHQCVHSNFDSYFNSKPSIPRLRSLLLFRAPDQMHLEFLYVDTICASFKLLRVLNLENMQIYYLGKQIGKLINLRYLGLKNTGIMMLPSSIQYLQSLQTLDISGYVPFKKVPNMIYKLKNLRHLYMNETWTGKLRIDTLENLQTLSCIHIDNWSWKNLKNLVNLRKLTVVINQQSDLSRFFDSIAKLERLVSLKLIISDTSPPSLTGLSKLHSVTKLCLEGRLRVVPHPDEFPPNISKLTLQGSYLAVNPMGVLKLLPKLSILRLRKDSYKIEQMTIYEGGFPLLKFLELEGLTDLECLTIQDNAMPRLRQLRISSCRWLNKLPDGIMSATSLQELEISTMPRDFVKKLRGADFYIVKHIPSVVYS